MTDKNFVVKNGIVVNSTMTFTGNVLTVGNSTVNSTVNSSLVSVANSTVSANLGVGNVIVGILQVNTTSLTVGANILVNSSAVSLGNTTVNSLSNGSLFTLANSTQVVNLQPGLLLTGIVTVNATVLAVGANVLANATQVSVGANVFMNSTSMFIGNSTVNVFSNSTVDQFANSTVTTIIGVGGVNVGANHQVTTTGFVLGNSTVNVTANSTTVSANAYVGNGVMQNSLPYFANTVGVVMTTDKTVGAGVFQTLTDASSIAWTMANGVNFKVTLAGNRTLANPGVLLEGRSGLIWVKQDGTGGRTLSFGNCFVFASNAAPSINVTAGVSTILAYTAMNTSNVFLSMPGAGVPL